MIAIAATVLMWTLRLVLDMFDLNMSKAYLNCRGNACVAPHASFYLHQNTGNEC